jgi:hypothetical protein
MNTDPEQIRREIDALLAQIPSLDAAESAAGRLEDVIDLVGRQLEEAHQVLVRALESVEKG